MQRRMAILGGGPVGLASLMRAVAEGWDARLYERGRVGEHIRSWGHVRMFSPHAMNVVTGGSGARDTAGGPLGKELLTGRQYVERHLEPLAARPELAARITTGTRAIAVSRDRLRKSDGIADPARARSPFRLLLADGQGERAVEADVVLDATGTFGTPNWLGQGGIPAVGERDAATALEHRLPDMPGAERARFAGRHTLIVGSGHSAATAVVWLSQIAAAHPRTRITWVTRRSGPRPVPEVAADPLAERARVTSAANDAAQGATAWLTHVPDASVLEVSRDGPVIVATLATGGGPRIVRADALLALVGYRPDLDLAREVQVQTCWATEGTYRLAAVLLAGEGNGIGTDCLAAVPLGPDTLLHPEAGFFTLGAKSFGRNPNFLIRTGLEQVSDVFAMLRERAA